MNALTLSKNALKELAYASRRRKMTVDRLSEEIREYKTKADRDIAENRQMRRNMNRKWGELATRMGTLVEDVVFPNFPNILHRCSGCSVHLRWHGFAGGSVFRAHLLFYP